MKRRGGSRNLTCEESAAGLNRWPLSSERRTSKSRCLGESQQENHYAFELYSAAGDMWAIMRPALSNWYRLGDKTIERSPKRHRSQGTIRIQSFIFESYIVQPPKNNQQVHKILTNRYRVP